MNKKLYVISGSSGVGKGTVIKGFLNRNPEYMLSVNSKTKITTAKPTVTPTSAVKPKSVWVRSGNNWSYYDKNGNKVTGWYKVDSTWYYFDSKGVMQTGWLKSGTAWYYLGSNGSMCTGWQKISNIWYYFNSSGVMVTGWQKIGNAWYFFDGGGAMKTGWLKNGGVWYYLKADGAMAASEYCEGYWLNADGSWKYPYKAEWKTDSKGKYFMDSSGWYAKNCSLKIDGKVYKFNAAGYCTNP